MGYYDDVYLKRLNRYGMDYQSRMQGQRERVFEDLLQKSVYRVDFLYKGNIVAGLLEKFKQDETRTMQYLLTRIDTEIPAGTILRIPNKNYRHGDPETDENTTYWLVYYLEDIKASGYNRYILLKVTHTLTWKDRDGHIQTTQGYFYGQENNMLKDELKSRSRENFVYNEDLKSSFFVLPINKYINKDDYFTITVKTLDDEDIVKAFRVTGFDIISTPGIEYVTVDPIYIKGRETLIEESEVASPSTTPISVDDDSFWLQGGND